MPIYTYRCTNCGVQFEQQQKFEDQSLTRCPECSKKTLRKIYRPVGIVFKGSGFYATDHRSPSGASRSSSGSKSGEDSKTSNTKESTSESSAPKDSGADKE
jgi:putative FmdB family regulatory protein